MRNEFFSDKSLQRHVSGFYKTNFLLCIYFLHSKFQRRACASLISSPQRGSVGSFQMRFISLPTFKILSRLYTRKTAEHSVLVVYDKRMHLPLSFGHISLLLLFAMYSLLYFKTFVWTYQQNINILHLLHDKNNKYLYRSWHHYFMYV